MKHVATLCALLLLAATAPAAPIILNEYNAVDHNSFLDADPVGASTKADSFFGRMEGNGKDWVEFVVVGDGTAFSTVDMRGWKIQIDDNAGATFTPDNTIHLSDNPYWSNVRAGTIVTFIENFTSGGGLDTGVNRVNAFDTQGYAWTNIGMSDTTYLAADTSKSVDISNTNTQFQVLDGSDNVVFGPAGEGISPGTGVGPNNIMKLQANPSAGIFPADTHYADGTTSTFGAPNSWSGGGKAQDFSVFVPEPATMSLLVVGGLALLRRKRA